MVAVGNLLSNTDLAVFSRPTSAFSQDLNLSGSMDENDIEFLVSMHYGSVPPESVEEIKLNVENISSIAHGFERFQRASNLCSVADLNVAMYADFLP